jgi:hypothetical protein
VSECKFDKLSRRELTEFVTKHNPSLRVNSFFAVWRVYKDLINVKRIKTDCGVSPLACHFRLHLSTDKYEETVEQLLDAMPAETDVPYSKV